MKKSLFFLVMLVGSVGLASAAWAHYLWLNVDNHHPRPGDRVSIELGWGHKFPHDGQPRKEMLKQLRIAVYGPQGFKRVLAVYLNKGRLAPMTVKLDQPGYYLVQATVKGYVTKTTEGYFYKPKDELENVVKSYWSETVAKALIQVGQGADGPLGLGLGNRFELVPVQGGDKVVQGGFFPVKVLLDDKPVKTMVYATYDGFSQMKDTFAWTTRSNEKGLAEIKILHKGCWLLKAGEELPYDHSDKADVYRFISTLTFVP